MVDLLRHPSGSPHASLLWAGVKDTWRTVPPAALSTSWQPPAISPVDPTSSQPHEPVVRAVAGQSLPRMARPSRGCMVGQEVVLMTATKPTTSALTNATGHVCTVRSPGLARVVFVALVVIGVAGGAWLAGTLLAGPWLADTLFAEGMVAGVMLLTGALLAVTLSRALGCGHCHTPECTCS